MIKVEDDQLSLAIGKAGQNVRLASKLTGWMIEVEKNAQMMQPAVAEEGEEVAMDSDTEAVEPVEVATESAPEVTEEATEEVAQAEESAEVAGDDADQ